MIEVAMQAHLHASSDRALVNSRVASTDNVRVELLKCSKTTIVRWHIARPELGLVCARHGRDDSGVTAIRPPAASASANVQNFWFSPEGVDAEGELLADGATDCVGLFVRPSFVPNTIREELPEPIVGFVQGVIGRAFNGLMGEFKEARDPLPVQIEGFAMGVLAHLALVRRTTARRRHCGGLAPWQLRRAKETLLADLSEKVPLIAVARACKLSISHFSRAFKTSTGMPPHQWLVAAKLESARHLLAKSETPLAEIADMCGFADQSHFSRAFGRFHAVSPGVWRREHRL